jgi:hypothetical protein
MGVVVGILVALRVLGLQGFRDIGWWVLTAPFWGIAALCWLNSWGARRIDHELRQLSAVQTGPQLLIAPSKRFKRLVFAIVVLKWLGISFFAEWSWQWMAVAFVLIWSVLCFYNVVRVGGDRYLTPASVLFLVTVALSGWHGSKGATLDLTWVMILLPSVFYGCFCWIIVLPRIHDLNRRIKRRNEYVSSCIDSGLAPQPLEFEFEPKMVSARLPGNDSRFRLSSLVILTVVLCTVHTLLGLIVGWSVSRLLDLRFHTLVVIAIVIIAILLAYYWVFTPVAFALRFSAKWCDCAHRPTLWCATILSCSAASLAFGWHFMGLKDPGFGFIGLFILAYILVHLLVVQAGAFGLISILTPVNDQPLSGDSKPSGDDAD